ncbi:dimethylhistidine N-methyltransferase [Pseudoroseomonas deserti]|uniref:Dimethylhistidine N-methyltransferase n=1 Tax=Teichococcus deserti TaxID=1817963 RepID=A0A1V2GW57_9PROT|nr:L-histidine N(alpha)-methyltransferase [Pseudoroseomonas deserti]ONG43847.1 dimethylhistidine N-methyltransferase [Pseudoroseomonas deserti]
MHPKPDLARAATSAFDPVVAQTALDGLTAARKTLPPHLLYDPEGCRLFDAITTLPEYYVTRTELALLRRVGPEVAALIGPGASVIEYGAGSVTKAALLLQALESPAAYAPLDIAEVAVEGTVAAMRKRFPAIALHPIVGNFMEPIALPDVPQPLLGFFPGSTIGNLDRPAAIAFLTAVRQSLGQGARFLVGVDLPKDPAILVPAYDDAAGVTAAFNMNLLHRLNREAAAEFDLAGFRHEARWNAAHSRIEMHLCSRGAQSVSVAGQPIRFAAGETIHTESSYKHARGAFLDMARAAGWESEACWTDDAQLFSMHLLR